MNKTLFALSCCVLFAACSRKDDTPAPPATTTPGTTNPPVTTANPYYFRFRVDGKSYNLTSPLAQYLSSDERYAGGFMQSAPLTAPSMMLEFRYDSAVNEKMMLSLAGKTFYFDSNTPRVRLGFDSTYTTDTRHTVDTANRGFFVKVNSITYLKKDTTIFNPVAVYVINGSCKGIIRDDATKKYQQVTDGEFNFQISRVDDK
jgi:hypothetical protein